MNNNLLKSIHQQLSSASVARLIALTIGLTVFLAQLVGLAEVTSHSPASVDAGVYLKGENSGKYHEETRYDGDKIIDTIDQSYVFNRLDSRVELSSKETYLQDQDGRLKTGHFEASASKTTVTTDIAVQDKTLQITIHSGSGKYVRNVPLTDELLGPEGLRRLLRTSTPPQTIHYKTFVSSLGAVSDVTVNYLGSENLSAGGKPLAALKTEVAIEGVPGKGQLWTDESGHLVRMLQDSPLGQIEIARDNYHNAHAVSASKPSESYQSTLAISNIRLPHPRKIEGLTVELTKKPGADPGWPEFASENQKILEKTPDRIVIATVNKNTDPSVPGTDRSDAASEKPNALIQSDDPEVQRLAKSIIGGVKDPWQKAVALQRWVAANMQFDTGIAMAPASELVRDRHGTCVGYSTLFAALARATNIPARLKLGYVYDSGIWGGHAWTEVLVNGHWIPLDAAEYFPGRADAARIAVITTTGESGTIEHIGDLAKLYGKVQIRTLSYTLNGKQVRAGKGDKDYVVEQNVYSNPYLDLRVAKMNGATLKDLDAHWPERKILTIDYSDGSGEILYGRANPDLSLQEQADALVTELRGHKWEKTVWQKTSAVRASGEGKQAIVAQRDDVLWAIVCSGSHAARVLGQITRDTKIGDLVGHRTESDVRQASLSKR